MELQKIKELIEVLKGSGLAELEFTQGEYKLRLVKQSGAGAMNSFDAPLPSFAPSVESTGGQGGNTHPRLEGFDQTGVANEGMGPVRSPLYGIVHLRPAPDRPVFAQPGDLVHPGQTLCVVEAMKIFHEVKADRNARLEALLVADGEEVNAGTHLFRLTALD